MSAREQGMEGCRNVAWLGADSAPPMPDCRTCTHSAERASIRAGGTVLWCTRHLTLAGHACAEFSREPGAD